MTKKEAAAADLFLRQLAGTYGRVLHKTHIVSYAQSCGIDAGQAMRYAALYISDGMLSNHINDVPGLHCYTVTAKGMSFIMYKGGYTELMKYERYGKTNIRFTWLRHWVWFYTAMLSLLVNFYFILKYLLRWL